MKCIVMLAPLIIVSGCRQASEEAGVAPVSYYVSLPEIETREGERISALKLIVTGTGARITAVSIPPDWFVDAGPLSGNAAEVTLDANHGLS